ncbi:ABC transporter permease [Quadrisphaera oryzae]|uniref:ABC transporter permease n=1 Tax=Quadrisphaera TaxID=317661 RepID=UPI001646E031|nr:ABC transporter permease [Quadrisphaera sp. RL12-1S]
MSGALPLRVEVARQLSRRRTRWVGVLVVALPLLLVGAFALGSDDGGGTSFVDLATSSAVNFAVFALLAASGFLFVVLVALFAGDTVAAEASWSSLRYLLAAPVGRRRLLAVKAVVASASATLGIVAFILVCLAVGAVAYGWGPLTSPLGDALGAWEALGRLGLATAYVVVQLSWVGALAFWLGTRTDAPLGAVGGAVLANILSAILASITALGDLRTWLPTYDAGAWTALLQPGVVWDDMVRGLATSLVLTVVFGVLAVVGFERKDITS